MIPTRFIDAKEYEHLLDLEEAPFTMIHSLDAMDFIPPRNGFEGQPTVNSDHVHLLFLNATEPCIYKDKTQGVLIILPKHDEITYDTLHSIHPLKGAWAYRISPHNWMAEDWDNHHLQYTEYWFKPTLVPKFNKNEGSTH